MFLSFLWMHLLLCFLYVHPSCADPLHVVNYIANSALKNQVYPQNRLHKKKKGKSVGVSRRYLL